MGRISNNQKAFNVIWQHFIVKKSKQSIVENDYTGEAYWALRGSYNRKDAIGLLLLDEHYLPAMERLTLAELLEEYPELQLVTEDKSLLTEFEWAHDIAVQSHEEFLERIAVRLRGIAEGFQLEIPK